MDCSRRAAAGRLPDRHGPSPTSPHPAIFLRRPSDFVAACAYGGRSPTSGIPRQAFELYKWRLGTLETQQSRFANDVAP